MSIVPAKVAKPRWRTTPVLADEPDPGGAPHQATEETLVIVPRLDADKIDGFDPVNTGRPFSYILTVTNYRGTTVTGVTLTDMLPPGNAMVTLAAQDLDALNLDWLAPPTAQPGPLYKGRTATTRGPAGEWLELIEV